jgi:hypothetical protein
MGASPFRGGRIVGRLAALGLACAGGALLTHAALAQTRSPAGDKGGAKGLAGTVVQFEEKPSRAVIYLEEKGGIVTPLAPIVERGTGEALPAPKAVAAQGAAPAAKRATKAATPPSNDGPSPLRAAQAKPAPAPGAARP